MLRNGENNRNGKEEMYCYECKGKIGDDEKYVNMDVFDSPFDEKSKFIHLHVDNEIFDDYRISCEDALYDEQWADFRYFDCPMCHRTIIRQCPNNGWHSYVRQYNGEGICLRCYETIILEFGIPRGFFEDRKIEGMFFNRQELRDAGYRKVEGMEDAYIRTQRDVEWYCDEAVKVMDKGYSVVTDYGRIAIGGVEGYVTLWAKREGGGDHVDE